jgi:hypothetical protein
MTPAGSNVSEYYQKLKIQSNAPDGGKNIARNMQS